MRRARIIVNPVAGRGKSLKVLPRIKEILRERELNCEFCRTNNPGHAVQLAEQASLQGFNEVVAVGGDGTVNEVINGLMRIEPEAAKRCTLGVIGAGSGNDFLFGMGISKDLEENCRIVAEGSHRLIDTGRVFVDDSKECRYFGNGIGIGFDAVVGFEAGKMKWIRGALSYGIAALKTIFLYSDAPVVKIVYKDKKIQQSSLMVSVMNGRRMGGSFLMTPHSEPDDGFFDLCIAGNAGPLKVLNLIYHFIKGTQERKKIIKTGRTDSLTVTAEKGSLPAHADGETLCLKGKKLDIDIIPKSIKLLC